MSEESYKVSFEHTDDGKQIVTVKSTTPESRAASPDGAIFGKLDNKYA